ncbi:NAD(P)/FAD-dependent oxidoreductase [Desulfallas sp. Bu1-1]|uniref:phytoene desaturase family protein n=1 Tax=Desulfallas sp. Bu1-1 TaxID=2787620 RepID=UPI00189E3644|nr:NAD(P)/FAD-dependent oxidoreductase [Desulfallas sp. Bu1-1]MBF7083011.1 NAD(P)/FAD-dependent oxidoreductase [Desulfallas sp. Bu1-1]
MKDKYDVIVIGGGVNGLCAAAYMAKCGQSVAVFEARNEVGTFCDTEEVMMPGVRCNLHASKIVPFLGPPYEELELERFGLEMISGHWGYIRPFKDGTALVNHNYDWEKTCQSIELISKKDADTCRRLFAPVEDKIVEAWDAFYFTPPSAQAFSRLVEFMSKIPGFPQNWADLTGYHVADMLFESDKVKCFFFDKMIESAIDPWHKGVGSLGLLLQILYFAAGCSDNTARGGSHLLPHALARCLLHYGGEIYQSCPVTKIIMENGEAKGVVLGEEAAYPGRKVMAEKAVVSDLTPVPTFLWLVGEENLPQEVTMAVQSYDYEGQVLFTNYWVLNEPLRFKCYDWVSKNLDPSIEKEVFAFNFGVEDPADYTRLMHCMAKGELPDPPMVCGACCLYTNLDPTQAPPGMHTVMTWACVPYNIRRWGDRKLNGPESWDDIREEYGDRVEDLLAEYAPNIKTAKVQRYIHTPLDNTRKNQSMLGGTWSGGAGVPHQFYLNRPFPGCGAPRTPIKKLYITEVAWARSTFLTQGYDTAVVVAEDLGVRNQPWWNVRGLEPYFRWLERHGRKRRIINFVK